MRYGSEFLIKDLIVNNDSSLINGMKFNSSLNSYEITSSRHKTSSKKKRKKNQKFFDTQQKNTNSLHGIFFVIIIYVFLKNY